MAHGSGWIWYDKKRSALRLAAFHLRSEGLYLRAFFFFLGLRQLRFDQVFDMASEGLGDLVELVDVTGKAEALCPGLQGRGRDAAASCQFPAADPLFHAFSVYGY